MQAARPATSVQVHVEIVPWLTRVLGYTGAGRLATDKTVAAGATLADLLMALVDEHPEFGEYALDGGEPACPHVCVTLNGELVPMPNSPDLVLREGDVVALLPQFAGG